MPATARRPLEDQDPVVLELLRLAAEAILAHPDAVPPALYDLCDTWADHLADALSRPGCTTPRAQGEQQGPVDGGQAAAVGVALAVGTAGSQAAEGVPATAARGGQPR